MKKRLWIIGSGKRVRETALPVLQASDSWELAGIASRTPKQLQVAGEVYEVSALDRLTAERLAGTDLVYLVVAKHAVPRVVQQLTPLIPSHCELLIETPVMLFKHFGHLRRLDAFRHIWVSEDCFTLPCWDPLRATGENFTHLHLDRSAYAYHGIAMARAVLGNDRVKSARRTPEGREVRFAGGATLSTREPRDYSRGRLLVRGCGTLVADHDPGEAHRLLAPVLASGALTGFRLDDDEARLTAAECAVVGEATGGDGLFCWMDGMKRVGFLRLLEALGAGHAGYALDDALEDAAVDYWLHRVRRYRATPFSDPRRGLARQSYRLLTMLARLRGA